MRGVSGFVLHILLSRIMDGAEKRVKPYILYIVGTYTKVESLRQAR